MRMRSWLMRTCRVSAGRTSSNLISSGAMRLTSMITAYLLRSRIGSDISPRSEEHTSELQSPCNLVCRLLLEKKKKSYTRHREALKQDIKSTLCCLYSFCDCDSFSDWHTFDPCSVGRRCAPRRPTLCRDECSIVA